MNTRLPLFLRGLAVLLFFTFPALLHAATLNVPAAAYPTIQSGVDAAQGGDTVLVADGTYTGSGNRDIDFHGKSLTVTSQNGPTKTIIDCGGYKSAAGSGNHRGFYIHSGEKAATISGFTVKNGYENFIYIVPSSDFGGGIFISNDNNGSGTITLTECIVSGNTASYGGGVYNDSINGTIALTDCTISGNTASQGDGGGVNNQSINGTITLTDCTVSKNTSLYAGGGVFNDTFFSGTNGTITLTNCTVSGNTASYSVGGGVYNANGYDSNNSTITLTNCTVSGNTGFQGGGVFNQNSTYGSAITMTNCVVFQNTAQSGGGIYNYNDTASVGTNGAINLLNCTVFKNIASVGGGVYNSNNSEGTIRFANCIVYNDVSGEIANDTVSVVSIIYSDIQGRYPGIGNINKDPLFVNASAGDLHLQPGSPCLGAGTPNGAPATDLDGTPRPNPPSMGAYELAAVPASITGFTLTPTQINAPGPTVAADVAVTGTFRQVQVSCSLLGLTGPPPVFNLTQHGNDWTGSFPTYFLRLAGTNPVTFTAYGIRPDGTITQKTTTLNVGPVASAPSLALYLSPLAGKVAPDQLISFQVVVSNITQAPALFTTISVTLPENLNFVASPGFSYDASKRTLVVTRSLLALPSVAKTFGSNLALLSFSARVKANAPQNSTLVIKSNVSCAGFQSTEQDASLIVGGAALPSTVRVDASQGLGILGGDVSVDSQGNTPLHATLTPKTSLNNWILLFGNTRPLTLWLEVQQGNGLTPTASDPIAGFLAQQGLLAPSGSPAYDATFAFIGDTKTITATFGPKAAALTLADMLIEILNLKNKGKGSAPTISQLLGFAEDIKTIAPLGDAVSAFTTPKPMTFAQYGQATAKAAKSLAELTVKNSTVRKKLVEAISNRFDILLDPEIFGQVFTLADNIVNLSHSFYDLVAFNVMTQGNPMTVSFVATTQ